MTTAVTSFCGCVCPKCRQQQHHNSCYCRPKGVPVLTPAQVVHADIERRIAELNGRMT